MRMIQTLISIPTARRIVTPVFYYFGNFDDLYLYSLHNRAYGDTMTGLFQQISKIESKKWTLLSF